MCFTLCAAHTFVLGLSQNSSFFSWASVFKSRYTEFSAIVLILSERVSSLTSSFLSHPLAYSSHAYRIMPKFCCDENETTGSLYIGAFAQKIFVFIWVTCITWPHGAYRNSEPEIRSAHRVLENVKYNKIFRHQLYTQRLLGIFWQQHELICECISTTYLYTILIAPRISYQLT